LKSLDELLPRFEVACPDKEQKLLLGEELFAYACSITMAGIQNQFPEADEAEQRRLLEHRLKLRYKLESGA
jgi:hypothetical protein